MEDLAPLPPSQIARELTYAFCTLCKNWFSLKEIDALFVFSGADDDWWGEPKRKDSSSRFNQAQGWFEGIRRHAPDQETALFRAVVERVHLTAEPGTMARDTTQTILARLDGRPAPTPQKLDRFNLHPEVIKASGRLFTDGHYRQAVLDAFIALNCAVQAKSGRTDLDGTPLMQTVFSVKEPVLTLSDDKNEQLGAYESLLGSDTWDSQSSRPQPQ